MKKSELKHLIRTMIREFKGDDNDDVLTDQEIAALRKGVAKVMKKLERDVKDAQAQMKEDPEGYIDASYIKMLKQDMKDASKIAQIKSVSKLAKQMDNMDTSPREDIEGILPSSLVNRMYE